MRATDNVCYHIKCNNTFPLVKAECVVFYCLLVHIMYIIQNKATFIVIENISPKIKNSIKFTINNHLLALDVSSIWWQPQHICYLIFYIKYYITIFYKKQANKLNNCNFLPFKKSSYVLIFINQFCYYRFSRNSLFCKHFFVFCFYIFRKNRIIMQIFCFSNYCKSTFFKVS